MVWVLLTLASVLLPLGTSILMQTFVCRTAKTIKTKAIFAAICSAAAIYILVKNTFFLTIAGAAAYIFGTVGTLIYHLIKNRKED